MARINWRLKSTVFGAIDVLHAPSLLYWMQKNVTGRSKAALKIDTLPRAWARHLKEFSQRPPSGTLFEFGAGKSLGQNLLLSPFVENQVVVDLNPMVDVAYVDQAAKQLAALGHVEYFPVSSLEELENHYRVAYKAPFDAATTGFADNSIGVCTSTNTLEHIPEQSIRQIFRELYRVLHEDGYISAVIDYSDHYAHTDPSIGLHHFLRFSERQWRRHNHRCHYQNRLRHYDFERLFEEAGFTIEVNETIFDAKGAPPSIDPTFDVTEESCLATSGYFVLRKMPG